MRAGPSHIDTASLLAMLAPEFAVICKQLNHAAFGNPTPGTLCNHAFQFGLQPNEDFEPPFNLAKPSASDRIRCHTRLIWVVLKGEQGADCLDFESQFASMANENEPAQISSIVMPPITFRARRL